MLRQSMIKPCIFWTLGSVFFRKSKWPATPAMAKVAGDGRCWNAWYVHLDSWHFNRGGAALTLWHALTSLAQNGDVSNLSMNQLILFQLCNCDSTATYIHIHPLAFISATFLGFQCHTPRYCLDTCLQCHRGRSSTPFGYHSMLCLDDGRLAPAVFQTKSQCKLWKICCYISDIPLVTLPKILWNLAIPYFSIEKKVQKGLSRVMFHPCSAQGKRRSMVVSLTLLPNSAMAAMDPKQQVTAAMQKAGKSHWFHTEMT